MKQVFFILAFITLFSCNTKKEPKEVEQTTNELYKQSEMAALMLQMYAVNLENKRLILEGAPTEKLTNFTEQFKKIHVAKLTDASDRNASFNALSEYYLDTYQQLFTVEKDALSKAHNNTINSCIACHKTTCIGPIPKIKKLLIQ
ncbi:hypothetical protein [Polaribacter sp. R77954]|uniref:hypothetical protein n=1 Tax=Polaribacter sp. R77954 TaxID=3093870 RepID=UPI0037CB8C74